MVTPTGFWVGTRQRDRSFVEVLGEPPFPVARGQEVSFVGYVDPNHEGTVERFAVRGEDAVQLREQGHHVPVEADALRRG